MMYQLVRPLLFKMDAEKAHYLTLKLLKLFSPSWLLKKRVSHIPQKTKQVFGWIFPNPVGLAAGMDKSGDYIDVLFGLGFGFIEIGTVTPRPQDGNPKPRLFRIPQAHAIINRMGSNNKGIDYCIERIKERKMPGIVGVNIGKNTDTPLERAVDDYRTCLIKAFPYVDYITINISSPNTPNLRLLQTKEYFTNLMIELKATQKKLSYQYSHNAPLLVKISIDLGKEEIKHVVDIILKHGIEGIVISNTTIDHSAVAEYPHGNEQGGVSGRPLYQKSLEAVKYVNELAKGKLPIIALGGIFSADDALAMMNAGASLVQIYTGLVYQGPRLCKEIVEAL